MTRSEQVFRQYGNPFGNGNVVQGGAGRECPLSDRRNAIVQIYPLQVLTELETPTRNFLYRCRNTDFYNVAIKERTLVQGGQAVRNSERCQRCTLQYPTSKRCNCRGNIQFVQGLIHMAKAQLWIVFSPSGRITSLSVVLSLSPMLL